MPKLNKTVTINSRKFDGAIHRSWQAEFVEQKNTLLIFKGVFAEEIKHSHLGVIRRGTISYEYYWLDRFYNVFRFHEPDGEFRNFYCNVNLPPKCENGVLDYIDLDIDVVVWKDFSIQILDLDEFEESSKNFNYTEDLIIKTKSNLEELLRLIENRDFPFDYK